MGLYSTVTATLSCSKCGREYQGDVQFTTDHEDGDLPRFAELERATGVPPGTYEGIADAYCTDCLERWMRDEKEASFEALAEAVARGELIVRRGRILRDARHAPILDAHGDFQIQFLGDRALSASEIAAAGREPDTRPGWPNFLARLHWLDYVVFDGAERIVPARPPSRSDWWQRHGSAVDRSLRARGWPRGESPWIDLPVVVSDDLVVRVERRR